MAGESKHRVLLCVILVSLTVIPSTGGDVNGGATCLGCSIVIGLVEQLAYVHSRPVTDILYEVCEFIPEGDFHSTCRILADIFGPLIIDLLEKHETPDVVCHAIGLCRVDPGQPQCNLFSPPLGGIEHRLWKHRMAIRWHSLQFNPNNEKDVCKIPGIDIICEIIERVADDHLPALDIDRDGFSTMETLRGSNWRGRDCSDLLASHRPGKVTIGGDIYTDSNCNGIYGIDASGESYEDTLCADSQPQGIVVLGDSASAHFHIPKQYVTATEFNKELLQYVPTVLLNEIDWPMTSTMTGFKNITWPILDGMPTDSMYLRMRERNRCNHRDYQSISVNGARSSNMLDTQESLSRIADQDYPVLLFYALIGNDVCNGHPDTLDHMTTVEEMRENVLSTLAFLNGTLPKGSHVVLMGLADGRALWDQLYNRYHPIGELRQDVTYENFYDFFNCLQTSPCTGWMNSNETIRELTTERAMNLSRVMEDIAGEREYENMDLFYIPNPVAQLIEEWEEVHGAGTGWQLIEPVDGFHPNQNAQAKTAEWLWEHIEDNFPHILGSINPNNQKIIDIFGDQGGH